MQLPNLKSCTEEELWHFVAYHFSRETIESVLVGPAAAAVYSKGTCHSATLNFVAPIGSNLRVENVLGKIGFKKTENEQFQHPDCPKYLLSFTYGPLAVAEDSKIKPWIKQVNGQFIRIYSPTDCIRDRLTNYIQSKAPECLDQAVRVAKCQPHDTNRIKSWCLRKNGSVALQEFTTMIQK